MIHDRRDDGSGGAVTFEFPALPAGNWVVKDDSAPNQQNKDNYYESKVSWNWADRPTDGGAYNLDERSFDSIKIEPFFNEKASLEPLTPGKIKEWQFLSGDAQNPKRISLDMDKPVEISPAPKGPKLTLTKNTAPYSIKQGQKTTVTVTVKNAGTTTIRDIEVKDYLPDELKFVEGQTSGKYDELKPGESRAFQYVLKSKGAGEFHLPQANATYADPSGNYHKIQSNVPQVEVIASLVDETPTDTATETKTIQKGEEKGIPGFEALSAIGVLLAVAYLLRRRY